MKNFFLFFHRVHRAVETKSSPTPHGFFHFFHRPLPATRHGPRRTVDAPPPPPPPPAATRPKIGPSHTAAPSPLCPKSNLKRSTGGKAALIPTYSDRAGTHSASTLPQAQTPPAAPDPRTVENAPEVARSQVPGADSSFKKLVGPDAGYAGPDPSIPSSLPRTAPKSNFLPRDAQTPSRRQWGSSYDHNSRRTYDIIQDLQIQYQPLEYHHS